MAGKRIYRDIIGDGFSISHDGKSEHFTPEIGSDSFIGGSGSRIDHIPFADGFMVTYGDGTSELFSENRIGNAFIGSSGTMLYPDSFGTGETVSTVNGLGGNTGGGASGESPLSDVTGIAIAGGALVLSVVFSYMAVGFQAILPTIFIAVALIALYLLQNKLNNNMLATWSVAIAGFGWQMFLNLIMNGAGGTWANESFGLLGLMGLILIGILILCVIWRIIGSEWPLIYLIPYFFILAFSLGKYVILVNYISGALFAIAIAFTIVQALRGRLKTL